MSFLVYKHTNKENGKVYIGITSQELKRRWQNGAGYYGTYFYNAIQKYGWDGFEHEILLEGLTKEQAEEIETDLIAKYGSANRENGYNVSLGAKYEKIRLGVKKYGKENHRSQAVKQINPETMEVVKVWESQNMAAETLGINRKGITKNCLGQSKTYMGYIWEYADKDFEKPFRYERGKYPHEKQKKKIKMIDTDGNTFYFESINDACEYAKVSHSCIGRYVKGTRNDATGRRWFYDITLD